MAQDLQHHTPLPHMPWTGDYDTYLYERNRVYKVFEGTRCACVTFRLPIGTDWLSAERRQYWQMQAMSEAVRIWEERWGEFDWWSGCQALITHTSLQVVIELRMEG